MKLLITTGLFPPDIGGPATYSKILAEELSIRGVRVAVLSFGLVRKLPRFIRHLVYFFKVLKLGRKAEVIFAQDPISVGLPSMLAAKILRKKFVLKIVGDYAWEQGVQRFGIKELLDIFLLKKDYPWQVKLLRWTEKLVAEEADKIITPSEYLRKVVMKWGVDEKKIEVVYNEVEFKTAAPIKHDNERWLVSVGRLVPWKGFDALIEIMPDLLKEFPDLKLKIVGGGPERDKLELEIRNYDLGNSVEMGGELSHEKTLSFIHSADIFILNSGYEGLSHVILEALSFGRPVLASRSGGNSEIVVSSKTGDLFEYNDREEIKNKISSLFKTGITNNEMLSQNGRIDFFDRFKMDNMIFRTKELLEKVCHS
ncbi:MAG: hypothetical protein A2921_04085 [Candidatus Magasanikbacteria bacterium RIFCSPLOWO2_01_FULL_43_20b]|uniref:Glycosyltransferase subfamily 4-like N-terminal domain-containing protein n=1 Tax=Candidatus Magasanikbacteria bacterium RIFCSPLOWO2_12_FULL_43_12 TaxID=1798692 RepID=A0A1F6MV10_9BACT|nr:MAG: hypothetical protein A3C74_03075 [Candidatus Magasanikbacteria bacterium RIFCSPHIGHO2_02_FULL_44_13]OGH72771.1 MAG: hypothetical protein A3I93_00835 [Candidatus Magasanikbacteria bacterium RIFCSPLOWO2_02_FULL_43_22]OGH73252.1 MAG: hypothetical protein A2921_04085 [Candidatus Magasanikbacteria bacterium RIFCSPLOWO2_01_FULL_43_20b]OGH75526.1 MAG: hypothetical protein A3G00_00485 [Candidatus Magasanikbacteria bacterium RIFCSPLOWO2_12_FULL_43_12]